MRLYQRKHGVWYVEFDRHTHRSLKTKDESKARVLYDEIERQTIINKLTALKHGDNLRISEFLPMYINQRRDLDEDTLRMDNLALRTLMDIIGDIPLSTITIGHIDEFKHKSLVRGLKPVTVNTYLRHIKAALNTASSLGYMKPVKIKMVKTGAHLPRVLTEYEVKLLLEKADRDMKRFIQFALYTGCRREEILKIRWQDVDGDRVKIMGKGDRHRYVYLVPQAREAMGEPRDSGPVFPVWHKDTLSKQFGRLVRKLGIDGVKFHSLRHTAATQMLKSGIPLEVVQRILGHQSIITTQIYARITDEMVQNEMNKLRFRA